MLRRPRNGMRVDSVLRSLSSSTELRRYPDMAQGRRFKRLSSYFLSSQKNGVKRIARWAIWSSKLLLGFRRLRSAEDLDRRLATNDSRPRSRSGHRPSPTPPTRLCLSVSRKSHALIETVRAARLIRRSPPSFSCQMSYPKIRSNASSTLPAHIASASQSGWGQPSGFVPLNAPPPLNGP